MSKARHRRASTPKAGAAAAALALPLAALFPLTAGAQDFNPSISIEKTALGQDADTPQEAVEVEAGSEVTWDYEVTNTGDIPLAIQDVVDDQGVDVVMPEGFDNWLEPGESVTGVGTGVVGEGEYVNVATVTAYVLDFPGDVVDSDPWHGIGVTEEPAPEPEPGNPAVDIEKLALGEDADTPEEAVELSYHGIEEGQPLVTWDYVVTNVGDTELTNIEVTDDDEMVGEITFPADFDGTLQPGESVTANGSRHLHSGFYKNIGTVVAEGPGGVEATDTDPWHANVVDEWEPEIIEIEKVALGEDADTPEEAVEVEAGSEVTWEYTVSVPEHGFAVSDIEVADDQGVEVVFPEDFDGTLQPGESVTATGTGIVGEGDYVNVGTVYGVGAPGSVVFDYDPWHGFGVPVEDPAPTPDPEPEPEPEPTVDPEPEASGDGENSAGVGNNSGSAQLEDTGVNAAVGVLAALALVSLGGALVVARRREAQRI